MGFWYMDGEARDMVPLPFGDVLMVGREARRQGHAAGEIADPAVCVTLFRYLCFSPGLCPGSDANRPVFVRVRAYHHAELQ